MELKTKTLLKTAQKKLEGVSPQPYQEAYWILSKILNEEKKSRGEVALAEKKNLEKGLKDSGCKNNLSGYLDLALVSFEQEREFWIQIQKRKNQYPLDYLLGESCFLTHKFLIEEGVFIPRRDTEILVERLFKQYPQDKALKIMDWGAGAGAICLSLVSYFFKAKALTVDIHQKSLDCLKKNRNRMGLKDRVFIKQGDVCKLGFQKEGFQKEGFQKEGFQNRGFFSQSVYSNSSNLKATAYYKKQNYKKKEEYHKFDLITANPPYIDPQDRRIDRSVYLFEPPVALFSSQKGMGHIYSWFYKAMEFLSSGACYAFEFGWNQSQLVKDFLSSRPAVASYEILKDSQGYDRVALVFKK